MRVLGRHCALALFPSPPSARPRRPGSSFRILLIVPRAAHRSCTDLAVIITPRHLVLRSQAPRRHGAGGPLLVLPARSCVPILYYHTRPSPQAVAVAAAPGGTTSDSTD
ncbi:hypothetical protein K466DRAFT_608041 [Polyporus arcularius HHB13444]|uniref:Uncharacterized protein n=1 Tax=Polyporus arcularius HHB13444 TaxID=1314778 RepID=A0A5C3NLI5_9APHY|nr:hypothetical protein K466DRAFT_608041 [Polyporus arcularius HHB13444]